MIVMNPDNQQNKNIVTPEIFKDTLNTDKLSINKTLKQCFNLFFKLILYTLY